MVHLLHVEMLALVRELMSKFMKPGAIPLRVKEILKVNVRDTEAQLSNKNLSVGRYVYTAMAKARVEKKLWVGNLYNSLREGYMKATEFLLKNLPLDNHIVTSLSALTPSLIQSESLCSAFMALGKALPNVVPSEALGLLQEEVRAYQIDPDLVPLANTYDEENGRVDVDWWSQVALLRTERGARYPTLMKLVRALLSIFTGPLVEGSFNIMDDILEADRCRMNVETYEGLAIIKSTMKARKWTASTMSIDQPLRHSCLASYKTYQLHLEKKKAREEDMRQKRMTEAMRVRSTAVANRIVSQARKSKRPAKDCSSGPSSSSTRPVAIPKTISSSKPRPFRPTGRSTSSSGRSTTSSRLPTTSSRLLTTSRPSSSSSMLSTSSSQPSTTSSSGPSTTSSSGPSSSSSSGPSTSSSGPSTTSSSGPSTSSSSGQPKLFSLFYGPAKKSTATASTTSGKRKSSDDSAPSKKWKK
ncbi:putative uncharacterized protein DDB_G0281733 [Neoarius graeffei]|uniref:putative uncharacterized protein DDB_G0281733 n=1 Tax=Neoarius graeffei TaxID=443677 RepID=UPI00298C5F03|nr:putative uncharacterized protein DDB_G0281733 [Neoarius graeffei]